MKQVLFAFVVALMPAFVHADEIYRWVDEHGVLHYSNMGDRAPADATVVKTPITLEVAQLPGAAAQPQPAPARPRPPSAQFRGFAPPNYTFRPLPDAPRIYDERRLQFGCFTAGTLYYGGFAHADDISPVMNCLPYRLGPEAWLNAARGELAMRQSGINPRDMMRLYTEGPREMPQVYEDRPR